MASSLVTVQDGNSAAVAAGNGQNVTPGNTVTIALVDSTLVQSWFLRVIWTNGAASEATFNANSLTVNQSPTWTATFVAPVEGTGFEVYSEVLATSGTPAPAKFGLYCAGAGDAKLAFPADPQQRITAMQTARFQPPAELQVAPGTSDPKVRAVATSIAAYTGTGTGTLTGSANGALAVQDGQTLVAGDLVHLPTGLANVTAADAGPYVVVSVGGAAAKYILARPGWFAHGSVAQVGQTFEVAQGTLYGGSTWKSTAVASVIGTTDAAFFPRTITQAVTLVAGTVAVTNVPILSATKSQVSYNRTTPNTTAATIIYSGSTITPGVLGTASLTFQAQVAAGTINAADLSTLNVTITNQL